MPKKTTIAPAKPADRPVFFPLAAGLFFFVVIVKLGSPIVTDPFIQAPDEMASALLANETWPPHWGVWLFLPLALAGLFSIEWNRIKSHWALALPLIWLGWELLAAAQTVSPALTKLTLTHFAVCVGLFYLGCFVRKGMANPWPVWAGMGLALCWAMRTGLEQHFGGLEATRKMVMESPVLVGVDPKWLADPEYLKRIASTRIFGTFGGYANSLAGGIELFLPLTLVFLWRLTPKVRKPIRVAFVLILGGCGLACLYWSGSKAGWLVALVMGLVALWHSPLPLKWRRALIFGMLILGVAGFAYKYSDYFHKERNSTDARFAYWRVAMVVIKEHPFFGTGPGTFQVPYSQLKRPGDESVRLCHNDYLEQAADSGVFGFLSFAVMIGTFVFLLYRYSSRRTEEKWLNLAVWLGVLGVCLHSFVDFHLYVAALAWPLFFLFGWMMNQIINDNVNQS